MHVYEGSSVTEFDLHRSNTRNFSAFAAASNLLNFQAFFACKFAIDTERSTIKRKTNCQYIIDLRRQGQI